MLPERRTLAVLLVDDTEVVVPRICELLSSLENIGEVRAVSNRVEALNALSDFEAQVVLLDLQLKQGGGLGILKAIRQSIHRPVIVVYTDHPSPHYREHALENGASYFLDQAYLESLPAVLESLSAD